MAGILSHLLLSGCGFSELDGLAGDKVESSDAAKQGDGQAEAEAGPRADAGSKADGGRAGDSGAETRDGYADGAPQGDGRADGGSQAGGDASEGDGGTCGCVHGRCSDGGCVCDVGFAGTTSCDTCAAGYFGPNCEPGPVGAVYAYVEAESGSGANTPPMMTGSDDAASGGQYTWSGTANSAAAVPVDGHVTYTFTDLPAGTFKVWGRFLVGPGAKSDDSLWVRMDSGNWTKWNDICGGIPGAWAWDSVRDDANFDAPVTYPLTAGTHTLEIAYREDGLKWDRFLLTNDLAVTP